MTHGSPPPRRGAIPLELSSEGSAEVQGDRINWRTWSRPGTGEPFEVADWELHIRHPGGGYVVRLHKAADGISLVVDEGDAVTREAARGR